MINYNDILNMKKIMTNIVVIYNQLSKIDNNEISEINKRLLIKNLRNESLSIFDQCNKILINDTNNTN